MDGVVAELIANPSRTRPDARAAIYRPDVDGLRCLAIVPVVLFHAGVPWLGGGFVGVDVFFVISGYLIGALTLREMQAGQFTLRHFYQRRARRILPALLTVVLASMALSCVILSGAELRDFAKQALATLTSLSNVYFGVTKANYFAAAAGLNPLLMTWSLSVEEQFYLAYPLLLFVLLRYGRGRVVGPLLALSALSLACAVWAVHAAPTAAFYLLPSRAWELGLGTALGAYETRHGPEPIGPARRPWLSEAMAVTGLALLAWAYATFTTATLLPGLPALLPTGGALLLIRARGSWVNRHILASRPLVWIGLVSYSWYLWHWPLMSLARIAMAGVLPLPAGLGIAGLSLALAALSLRLVERPFRRPSTSGRSTLWRYGAATALCCAPALLLVGGGGWPGRYPAARRIDAVAADSSAAEPCLTSWRATEPSHGATCVAALGRPALAIMGDSHAAALAPYLRSAAEAAGWGVADLTKTSCPQLGGVTRFVPSRPGHDAACAAFNRRAMADVISDPAVRTVVLAGFWTAPFRSEGIGERFVVAGQDSAGVDRAQSWVNFEAGLEEAARTLRDHGKRVLLAVDVPQFDVDPLLAARTIAIWPRSALAHDLGGPELTGVEPRAAAIGPMDERATAILRAVATRTGAGVLDPTATLCDSAGCRYLADGAPLYVDTQHLSFEGSAYGLAGQAMFH